MKRRDVVQSFVIGFGDEINSEPETLEQMAMAGGTGSAYSANSADELDMALTDIAGQVSAEVCTVVLDSRPEDSELLAVFLDNVAVPRSPSHGDGWDLDPSGGSITFYGEPCTLLRSGDVNEVRVEAGCGGPIVE